MLKFCVGSRQHVQILCRIPSTCLDFVSDPNDIRHKTNNNLGTTKHCQQNFVLDPNGIPHKRKFWLYLIHFSKIKFFYLTLYHPPRCPCRTQIFWLFHKVKASGAQTNTNQSFEKFASKSQIPVGSIRNKNGVNIEHSQNSPKICFIHRLQEPMANPWWIPLASIANGLPARNDVFEWDHWFGVNSFVLSEGVVSHHESSFVEIL